MSLLTTLTGGGRQWSRPEFTMPMPTAVSDLKPLGADRTGRQWFSHKKYGEMIELGEIDSTRRDLPNTIVVEVDRDRFRAFTTPVAWGTYERLMNTPGRVPRAPKPHRPIPATAGLFLAEAKAERIYASAYAVSARDAEPPARGGAEYVARIERTGARIHGCSNPEQFRITSPGGVLSAGVRELADAEHRTIAAHVNNVTVYCEVGKHARPHVAVSTLLGGALACSDCVDGGEA